MSHYLVTATPDATLAKLREGLQRSAGLATIWREFRHLDLTLKINCIADEQRRHDVALARRQWRECWRSRRTDHPCSANLDQSGVAGSCSHRAKPDLDGWKPLVTAR